MQVVNYPPNGLQTPLRSVPDTNSIPTTTTTSSTTTSNNTSSTTITSSSSTNDIITNAKEFLQDNSTYLLVGVGLVVLLVVLRN
jgi:beta-lactamase regulating signal transducer with metallopeptidase domain